MPRPPSKMLQLRCENCNDTFAIPEREHVRIRNGKAEVRKFCGRKCWDEFTYGWLEAECQGCCKKFKHRKSIPIFPKFCSRPCSAKSQSHDWLFRARKYAAEKGGQCLSEAIPDGKSSACFKCSIDEHPQWNIENITNYISSDRWCLHCGVERMAAQRRGPLKNFLKVLKDLNFSVQGKLLDVPRKHERVELQCIACGYEFSRVKGSLRKNSAGCFHCQNVNRGKRRRIPLNLLKDSCRAAGFELLTDKDSLTTTEQVLVKCHAFGHVTSSTLAQKRKSVGCGDCSKSTAEQFCMEVASRIFGVQFKTKRFKIRIDDKLRRVEFDGWNEKIKVCVEHNGSQHYRYSTLFHDSYEDFLDLQNRDHKKFFWAREQGYVVIVIRELGRHVSRGDLANFIVNEAKQQGFEGKMLEE